MEEEGSPLCGERHAGNAWGVVVLHEAEDEGKETHIVFLHLIGAQDILYLAGERGLSTLRIDVFVLSAEGEHEAVAEKVLLSPSQFPQC